MRIFFKHKVASQLRPLLTDQYGANPAIVWRAGGRDGGGRQRAAEFREEGAGVCWSVGEDGTRWDRCVKGNFCPA